MLAGSAGRIAVDGGLERARASGNVQLDLDIARIRSQFPITRQRFEVIGRGEPKPLIYMDHGASTHPPTFVLETYKDFLEKSYANVNK